MILDVLLALSMSTSAAGDSLQGLSERVLLERKRVELLRLQQQQQEIQKELSDSGELPSLMGVFKNIDDSFTAMFQNAGDDEAGYFSVGAGDLVNQNWRIEAIESGVVILRGVGRYNGSQRKHLTIGRSVSPFRNNPNRDTTPAGVIDITPAGGLTELP
jgi:hypothetical protein